MKKLAKKSSRKKRAEPRKKYVVCSPIEGCWIAHSATEPLSGVLLFNHNTGKFHAFYPEAGIHFPPLASGKYGRPEDRPLDEHHRPKSDFLMLLALRGRFKEHMPGSDLVARSWRRMAFERRRQEIEENTGKRVSGEDWQECERIASSSERFDEYAMNWLVHLIQKDDASKTLIRLGKWLEKADDIENGVIPPRYTRFYNAVETAAQEAGGVPTQKAARAIFERGLSANQLGEGEGFRSLMRQLHFDWLPAGGRGPAKIQEKSGVRSKN